MCSIPQHRRRVPPQAVLQRDAEPFKDTPLLRLSIGSSSRSRQGRRWRRASPRRSIPKRCLPSVRREQTHEAAQELVQAAKIRRRSRPAGQEPVNAVAHGRVNEACEAILQPQTPHHGQDLRSNGGQGGASHLAVDHRHEADERTPHSIQGTGLIIASRGRLKDLQRLRANLQHLEQLLGGLVGTGRRVLHQRVSFQQNVDAGDTHDLQTLDLGGAGLRCASVAVHPLPLALCTKVDLEGGVVDGRDLQQDASHVADSLRLFVGQNEIIPATNAKRGPHALFTHLDVLRRAVLIRRRRPKQNTHPHNVRDGAPEEHHASGT
mmetsp:Transcript_1088/g.4612  ORF Transcript_1088/g.4612 Transcript_1088/m.4612 type:complete len:321 (-) Transcript_1088:5697-6659(-)